MIVQLTIGFVRASKSLCSLELAQCCTGKYWLNSTGKCIQDFRHVIADSSKVLPIFISVILRSHFLAFVLAPERYTLERQLALRPAWRQPEEGAHASSNVM